MYGEVSERCQQDERTGGARCGIVRGTPGLDANTASGQGLRDSNTQVGTSAARQKRAGLLCYELVDFVS